MRCRPFGNLWTRVCWLVLLPGCFYYSNFSTPDLAASSLIMSAVNIPTNANSLATARVTVRQSSGRPVPGLTVSLAADKCRVVQPPMPTDANGRAQGQVASAQVGQHTVQATVTMRDFSSPLNSNVTLNFYAPADGNNAVPLGAPLNSQVVALIPGGDVDPGYTGTAHFTCTDPQATLPADYTFSSKDMGSHIFVGSLILRTPGVQTVTATDVATGKILSQETFLVAAPVLGEAVLQVAGLAQNVAAGAQASFQVLALDASGHGVPGYLGTVTFSSSDPQAALPPPYMFTAADRGVANFTATLKTAGSQWIAATDETLTSNQAHTAVGAAAAASFGVSGVTSGVAGSQNTATVTARDAFGNQAVDYHGTVHFSSSDARALLPADALFMAGINEDQGSKTFTHGVALVTVGTQSVSVWDTSDPNIAGSQTGLVITPAAAAKIMLAAVPLRVTAGQALSPQATVVDAYANVVTGFQGGLQFSSSDAAALLPPLTVLSSGEMGEHTFVNGLTLTTSGTQSVTVAWVDSPSVSGTVANIGVQPTQAVALSVSGLANTVNLGYAGSITVTARDPYGNVAQNYTGTVDFSSTDAQAALPPAAVFGSADQGSKTFSGGVTLRTQGDQNIVATDNGAPISGQRHVTAVRVTGLYGGLGYASCASFSNGALKCWGYNNEGELGLGDAVYRGVTAGQMGSLLPAVNVGPVNPNWLSIGDQSTCAVLQDGNLKCWGGNGYGQLGLGDIANRGSSATQMGSNLPTLLLGSSSPVVAVGAGLTHVCALLADGSVKCWGSNSEGELGVGDTTGRGQFTSDMGAALHAVPLGTGVAIKQLSTGNGHTCGLTGDGKVKCWGYNYTGELGLGDSQIRGDGNKAMGDDLPFVQMNGTATQVATGYYVSCALLSTGAVKCWGDNTYGELGLGDSAARGYTTGQMGSNLPAIDLGQQRSALAISAGAFHVCALLDTHQIKCWGDNRSGNLGLGDTHKRGTSGAQMGDGLPVVDLGSGRTAQRLAAGQAHTCALLDNNQIKCWGYNTQGQLGLGDTSNRGAGANQMGSNLPAVVLW